MNKKLAAGFIITFFVTFGLTEAFFVMLQNHQTKIDIEQTKIIQDEVKERFKLFLDLPLSIGIIGSEYFADGNLESKNYGPFAKDLLETNTEIIGLNLVDPDGKIVRVYPMSENTPAMGRISQNYSYLQKSWNLGEKYWFSAPFYLYQKKQGFAFYVPIVKEGILKGWFASVISTKLFFEKFKLPVIFESYDLIIKDKLNDQQYFSTSSAPDSHRKVYESISNLRGRDLVFQSWRKNSVLVDAFPWYWSFLSSLFMSLLALMYFKLNDQKKKIKKQLAEIAVLLRLTSKEALANLVELHSTSMEPNASYLTNLIEQIDLLQTIASTGEELESAQYSFLDLLEEPLDNFMEISAKKDLAIIYDKINFQKLSIKANGWLLKNSVLSNIISHSIIHARHGSRINIEYGLSDNTHYITFHTHKLQMTGAHSIALKMDRRLEVARKILHMHAGELFIQNDLSEGLIIRITLPNQA